MELKGQKLELRACQRREASGTPQDLGWYSMELYSKNKEEQETD